MEVRLSRGKEPDLFGKVIGNVLDKDGKPVGSQNDNPILNSRLYEVRFDDGLVE